MEKTYISKCVLETFCARFAFSPSDPEVLVFFWLLFYRESAKPQQLHGPGRGPVLRWSLWNLLLVDSHTLLHVGTFWSFITREGRVSLKPPSASGSSPELHWLTGGFCSTFYEFLGEKQQRKWCCCCFLIWPSQHSRRFLLTALMTSAALLLPHKRPAETRTQGAPLPISSIEKNK